MGHMSRWPRRIFCLCEAWPFARRAGADCPKGGSHFARQRWSAFPEGALPKTARGAGSHLPQAARGVFLAPSLGGCLVAVFDLTATK